MKARLLNFVPQTNDPILVVVMPDCPHCNKNDRVFASHMFGKKDMACTRCKRTFRPAARNKKAQRTKDIMWTKQEYKSKTRKQINRLLADGHNITLVK